jgi:hypothetical protein
MSEESIAEVTLPPVRVPEELKKIVEDLQYLVLKGDRMKMYLTADIMREALFKGLRLMLLEREVFDRIMEKEAENGAMRIHASLVKPAKVKPQVIAGESEGLEVLEEKKVSEEPEDVEETEEEEMEEE